MTDGARSKWRRELGQRIAEARRAAGFSQSELAKRVDQSKQLVSHWENAVSEVTSFDLSRLSRVLRVSLDWLALGVEPAAGSGVKLRLPSGVVPHPTAAEALEIAAGKLDPSQVARARPTFTLVTNALAVDVLDAGLAALPPGRTVVIVDRDKKPEHDDVVAVALLATAELLIRRYEPGRKGSFSLKPDNRLLPEREVTAEHQAVVLGVVIESVVVGSR